jgi:hypothetical protein
VVVDVALLEAALLELVFELLELAVGGSGEFTVWLDDKLVAEKKLGMFPSAEAVVAELKKLLP